MELSGPEAGVEVHAKGRECKHQGTVVSVASTATVDLQFGDGSEFEQQELLIGLV